MMLSEIAKALSAPMRGADVSVLSVGTDSRSIAKGQLFVGISAGLQQAFDHLGAAVG